MNFLHLPYIFTRMSNIPSFLWVVYVMTTRSKFHSDQRLLFPLFYYLFIYFICFICDTCLISLQYSVTFFSWNMCCWAQLQNTCCQLQLLTGRAETNYGANVLDCFLARSLLWQKAATTVPHRPHTCYYIVVVWKPLRGFMDLTCNKLTYFC